MKFFALFFSLAFSALSFAADSKTSVADFKILADHHIDLCRHSIKTSLLYQPSGVSVVADLALCRKDAEPALKDAFQSAVTTVKKPAANSAFKSYYAAWVAALRGLTPGSDEAKIAYHQRQEAAKVRLDELWVKFEIEL